MHNANYFVKEIWGELKCPQQASHFPEYVLNIPTQTAMINLMLVVG